MPAEELEEFNDQIIGNIKVIEAYHLNPENQYVLVKETFKVRNDNVIAFEFINKKADFEITDNSAIEDFKLKKYLDIPREVEAKWEN